MTPLLELACTAIVLVYVLVQTARAPDRRAFLARMLLIAVAAWVGEDGMIRAYGFYAYDPGWHVFLDRTPLLVPLIWPVVIDSADRLARHLGGGALLAGALVLADAALIEPVCVRAGLWSWTAPGPFDVPLVGVLGWGFFGGGAALLLRSRPVPVVLAPLVTHALVLASWWGALRWVGSPPESACVALAWLVSLALALRARRAIVPLAELLARLPGAAFFFGLLVVGRAGPALVAWALAFVPPYLVLTLRAVLKRSPCAERSPSCSS